jgi:AcrR family transcriptional regulator
MQDNQEASESPTRREREKAQHRQEIINAAIQVFDEKGFYAATLDEIAQKAEFSKGALYLYFQNKEELLFVILTESVGFFSKRMLESISDNKPFREVVHDLLQFVADAVTQNPKLFAIFNAQNAGMFKALSNDKREELMRNHHDFLELLRTRTVRAVEMGEIRKIMPDLLVGMLDGAMHSMLVRHWKCETTEQMNFSVDEFVDILFNGISYQEE